MENTFAAIDLNAKNESKVVGVLALQGAFSEHINMLNRIAAITNIRIQTIEVRTIEELHRCDSLILPGTLALIIGGESTAQILSITRNNLLKPLRQFISAGNPVWGVSDSCLKSA